MGVQVRGSPAAEFSGMIRYQESPAAKYFALLVIAALFGVILMAAVTAKPVVPCLDLGRHPVGSVTCVEADGD